MTAEQDCLTDVLAAEPPAAVKALPGHVHERLADQIVLARQSQQALADEAVATALKGVPLPVRGIVKKALGG